MTPNKIIEKLLSILLLIPSMLIIGNVVYHRLLCIPMFRPDTPTWAITISGIIAGIYIVISMGWFTILLLRKRDF